MQYPSLINYSLLQLVLEKQINELGNKQTITLVFKNKNLI